MEIKVEGFTGEIEVFDNWDLGTQIIEFDENTNPTKIEINKP
ncbi:hypothetical protein DET49_104143 [Salegentibacter sp. 24]|nr:hypothetical protein [Salegentibacter sp. 24]TDN93412.1 hypothetical protein DET49_104143 [Salegentibacter sp. 24]